LHVRAEFRGTRGRLVARESTFHNSYLHQKSIHHYKITDHKMSIRFRGFIYPFIAIVLGSVCVSVAYANDEAINGRVRSSSGDQVNACFDQGTTLSAGEEFEVVRHALQTPPKGVTTIKSAPVGMIRIEAVDAHACATAKLLPGSAQALDWVEPKFHP